ncbi:unnamed protein product [Timema podura]|uniref:Uncharacterized protein n=1 Tax=Timema podura TaxID=61482 RepID=A0ABN7NYA8_TIMPD|nr:unnamed protein product [Timema podura]
MAMVIGNGVTNKMQPSCVSDDMVKTDTLLPFPSSTRTISNDDAKVQNNEDFGSVWLHQGKIIKILTPPSQLQGYRY